MRVITEVWPGLDVVIGPLHTSERQRALRVGEFVARDMQRYMPLGADLATWRAWWAACRGEPEGVIERCMREAIQADERRRGA